MTRHVDVAIIGAGPYGLSIAAHLRAAGADYCIFGRPMQTWQTQILRDSHLKSDGFATNLYEPTRQFTLKHFCESHNLPYGDTVLPVPRGTFATYALAFQERFVPDLIQQDVVSLQRAGNEFLLRLENDLTFTARRVVVAVGISHFHYVPEVLQGFPAEYVSHSSQHYVVDKFAGKDVIVVGAGASAVDLAVELLPSASRVRIVARRKQIRFGNPPKPRSLADKIRAPMSGLGPGWKSRFSTDAPLLFHFMPEQFRVEVVKRHLGPAPCWFTRDAVERKAEFVLGATPLGGKVQDGRIQLSVTGAGTSGTLEADHVIAATGYRVDLKRLAFMPDDLLSALRKYDTSPAVSMNFESSVPGLYFVGLTAANSFGPLLRFAFGANFASRRLSGHLVRTAMRGTAPAPAPMRDNFDPAGRRA